MRRISSAAQAVAAPATVIGELATTATDALSIGKAGVGVLAESQETCLRHVTHLARGASVGAAQKTVVVAILVLRKEGRLDWKHRHHCCKCRYPSQ